MVAVRHQAVMGTMPRGQNPHSSTWWVPGPCYDNDGDSQGLALVAGGQLRVGGRTWPPQHPQVSLVAPGEMMAFAQVPSPWEARPKQQTKPRLEATDRLWNWWQGHRCSVPVTPPTPQHPTQHPPAPAQPRCHWSSDVMAPSCCGPAQKCPLALAGPLPHPWVPQGGVCVVTLTLQGLWVSPRDFGWCFLWLW